MRLLFTCLTLLLSLSAAATDRMYAVGGITYSDSEFSDSDDKGVGYTLAIGHQFAPKWYVEAGYLSLLDELDGTQGMDADAIYLALLGKAGSREGELFYKVGVARADIAGFEPALAGGNCRLGELSGSNCRFDEGILAGMIGLGFDYHIGMKSMIRLEYTYLGGEDSFSTHWVNLAFRYNFN